MPCTLSRLTIASRRRSEFNPRLLGAPVTTVVFTLDGKREAEILVLLLVGVIPCKPLEAPDRVSRAAISKHDRLLIIGTAPKRIERAIDRNGSDQVAKE